MQYMMVCDTIMACYSGHCLLFGIILIIIMIDIMIGVSVFTASTVSIAVTWMTHSCKQMNACRQTSLRVWIRIHADTIEIKAALRCHVERHRLLRQICTDRFTCFEHLVSAGQRFCCYHLAESALRAFVL